MASFFAVMVRASPLINLLFAGLFDLIISCITQMSLLDRVVQLVMRPTCDRLIAGLIPTLCGALGVWPETSVSNSLVC
jgi:hypothetical protein